MPLTPTDVANKLFRRAFRGYSLAEVDAFLDEVETELSRLLSDNAELKNLPAAAGPPAAAQSSAPAAEPLGALVGQEGALRTLLLAQRTADEAIAEARAEAEQILVGARTEAKSTATAARTEADRLLGSARSEAESTLSASKSRAGRVDEEVAARIQAATGDLGERRRSLEARIEELRAFEREYRTRLKAYLETQLRDLDSRSGPDDGGAGVPAAARSAAVGSPPAGAVGGRPRGAAPTPATPTPATPTPATPPPDSPPRQAPPSGLRSPQRPAATTGPEPAGPFRSDPRGGQGDGKGDGKGEPPEPR